jgi:pyrroloquinoline quinone (PQQ) biosynthesis protein C
MFSSSWKEAESYLIKEKSLRFDGSFYYPDRICELWETMRDMDLSKKLLLLFVDDFADLELM